VGPDAAEPCYILTFYFSFKLFRILRTVLTLTKNLSTDNERITRRAIVRAFLYQACIPLVLQLPQFLASFISAILILFGTLQNTLVIIKDDLINIALITLSILPLADSLIVFMIIKPYRRALRSALSVAFPSLKVQTTVFILPVQHINVNRHKPRGARAAWNPSRSRSESGF
jgi:hypothetical protein